MRSQKVNGLCLPLDREALKKRDRLAAQGNWDDPVFDEARTFLEADIVVLAVSVLGKEHFRLPYTLILNNLCHRSRRLDKGGRNRRRLRKGKESHILFHKRRNLF